MADHTEVVTPGVSPSEPGSPEDFEWTCANVGSVAAEERQSNAAESRILARQRAESVRP